MRFGLIQKRLRDVEMISESEVSIQKSQGGFGVGVYQRGCRILKS